MSDLSEQKRLAGLPELAEAEKVSWDKLAKRCCNLVDAFKSLCDYAKKADKGDDAAKKNFIDLLSLVTNDYSAIIKLAESPLLKKAGF